MGAGEIRRLLDSHGISPSRALGQNFVVDPNTIVRMVQLAGVVDGDHVIEVGPGVGSLTIGLSEAGATVVAIELDRHLLAPLAEVTEAHNVQIVHADAMEIDWSEVLAGVDRSKLVANLPYNISAPLILNVLEQAPAVGEIHVMVQREVGERLAASVGDPQYGIPSVMRSYWATARVVAKVPPTVFHPVPRVDSAIVSVVRHDATPDVEAAAVRSLVSQAYGQRRKMLRKSLGGRVDQEVMEAAGIAPTSRPEELDIAQWCDLVRALQRAE